MNKGETNTYEQSGDIYERLSTRSEEKKEKKKRRNFFQMISYYSFPFLSIGVFITILALGSLPSVQSIREQAQELKTKREKVSDLNSQIESLKRLKAEEYQLESDLRIVEKIVPSSKTQVADFVGEIYDLAQTHELQESEHSTSEEIDVIEEDADREEKEKDSAAVIRIPTTSEYTADFESIEDFLEALYKKDDFILVRYLDMKGHLAREYLAKLQRQGGGQVTVDATLPMESWTMEVTFEKYQFSDGFNDYLEGNFVSLNARPDEETIEFIRQKYGD